MSAGKIALAVMALATAALAASQAPLAQAPSGRGSGQEDGQLAFNNACRTCHTLREGDNRLGPSLYKIIGRKAGTAAGYGYSASMKNVDLVWDKATLDRFIANPDAVVPGNAMKPYGGIDSAEERAKIIAYLEASGGS